MNSKDKLKEKIKLEKIRSKYILKQIFNNLNKKNILSILKYNKNLRKKLNITGKDYKKYCEIEIEIIPQGFGPFINFNEEEEQFFHIYFDKNKEEIKCNYLNEGEKIKKIKIIIDYQVKSFYQLFIDCKCIVILIGIIFII